MKTLYIPFSFKEMNFKNKQNTIVLYISSKKFATYINYITLQKTNLHVHKKSNKTYTHAPDNSSHVFTWTIQTILRAWCNFSHHPLTPLFWDIMTFDIMQFTQNNLRFKRSLYNNWSQVILAVFPQCLKWQHRCTSYSTCI